jgi:hypothetical protein
MFAATRGEREQPGVACLGALRAAAQLDNLHIATIVRLAAAWLAELLQRAVVALLAPVRQM